MSRIARLDALRGLAILLVMLRHALPDIAPGAGVVGVVVFFALSGYLITGLLLRELHKTGRIALRSFFRRRAVRLLPALVVLVAGFALVTLALDPLGDRDALVRVVLVALTYTADLPFAHGSDAIFHLWTLAVEEQFYLLWPFLLGFAWRRGRTTFLLSGSLVLLVLVGVGINVRLGDDFDMAYPWPTSWAGAMVLGAAAALVAHRRSTSGAARHRQNTSASPRAKWAAPVALVLLVAAGAVPWRSYSLTYPWGGLLIAALTVVVIRGWAHNTSPLGRVQKVLAHLGTISYAAYLWNYPLTMWLRPWHPVAGPIVTFVLTLLLATASWFLIERPITRRWSKPRKGSEAAPSEAHVPAGAHVPAQAGIPAAQAGHPGSGHPGGGVPGGPLPGPGPVPGPVPGGQTQPLRQPLPQQQSYPQPQPHPQAPYQPDPRAQYQAPPHPQGQPQPDPQFQQTEPR